MSAQNPTPDDLRTIAQNLQSEGHTSRAEVLNNAADKMTTQYGAMEQAREAIDLFLSWGPKTQSDEYLVETRLKEALEELNKVMQ